MSLECERLAIVPSSPKTWTPENFQTAAPLGKGIGHSHLINKYCSVGCVACLGPDVQRGRVLLLHTLQEVRIT